MKKTHLFLLLAGALSLMSCASSQPQRQPVAGGEMISFPSQHISFLLPDGWKTMPKTKGPGRLLGAARENEGGQPGGMVFALISVPETSFQSVTDKALFKTLQGSWARKGFTKFSKPQLVRVGGREALRFEAQKPQANQALLNYTFIHQGQMTGLLFSYYGMPVTKGPAVQRLVDSFSISQ